MLTVEQYICISIPILAPRFNCVVLWSFAYLNHCLLYLPDNICDINIIYLQGFDIFCFIRGPTWKDVVLVNYPTSATVSEMYQSNEIKCMLQ